MALAKLKIVVKPHGVGISLLRSMVLSNLKMPFFIARKPTGEVYDTDLANQFPERDWILSRILWLSGLEEGFNRGEGCDTYQRYIYIHGTPDSEPMGMPMSHGCIRMRNTDVIELFELIDCNALVYISEHKLEL